MAAHDDPINGRLLNAVQEGIPLVERPLAAIGTMLGLNEEEVLARLQAMSSGPERAIRQISAIFDSRALGYQSCLVAARVEESRIEEAAAVINEHPGVSHNYRRNHAYNLWFTLAVPLDSRLGLERTVETLQRRSGAVAMRLLPSLKLYKIGVKFDMGAEDVPAQKASRSPVQSAAVEQGIPDSDKKLVRVLQQNLPLVSRPFDAWAEAAGVSVAELLAGAKRLLEGGQMRRFSAVLRHRQVGYGANAMGVWVVPAGGEDAFGERAAGFAAVSHCYLRPSFEDWPYNLFTMVHGRSPEDCVEVLKAISEATGIREYSALFSSKEYKKVRVQYFVPEIREWEERWG